MWWHRPLLAALAVTAAISLAGCGIQPLYGTTAGGSRLAAAMAGVDVTPIPGRVGQRVRNELIFENTGGSGQTGTTYKLDIVIKESLTNELVKISGDAKSQVYQLDATFKLVDSASGRVVLQGKGIARAPYNRFQEIFANIRARYDAENRAARSVAESIRTQIAAFLANAA